MFWRSIRSGLQGLVGHMCRQEIAVKVKKFVNIQGTDIRNGRQNQRRKQNRVRSSVNRTEYSDPKTQKQSPGNIHNERKCHTGNKSNTGASNNAPQTWDQTWDDYMHLQLINEQMTWSMWVWQPCCLYAGASRKWSFPLVWRVSKFQLLYNYSNTSVHFYSITLFREGLLKGLLIYLFIIGYDSDVQHFPQPPHPAPLSLLDLSSSSRHVVRVDVFWKSGLGVTAEGRVWVWLGTFKFLNTLTDFSNFPTLPLRCYGMMRSLTESARVNQRMSFNSSRT